MPFTVQQLIEGRQKPVTVTPDESAQKALELMIRHDFSQLPVVERDEKLLGIVTSDSILRGLKSLKVTLNDLLVNHAYIKLGEKDWFRADDDLFALLDNLRDTYAVLIVDSESSLSGIVTSYDATEYFRRRAEDIMLIEDIEGMLKESILNALYAHKSEIDNEIKTSLGEALTWEAMGNRPASRIAIYHPGAITDSQDKLTKLQDWAVPAMTDFHKVMEKWVIKVLDEVNAQNT